MAVTNKYSGVGTRAAGTSTHGQNTVIHYYDKAGVKAANAVSVYAQFADRRSMPLKMGTTYKVSKWLHIFDRDNAEASGGAHADWDTKGYLSSRSALDVSTGLTGAAISEGSGPDNKQSIEKVTLSTTFARYGEMIDYTDEVEMFAEDNVQVHYREELGLLANRRSEDLVQLDMLSTTNMMYVGTASSIETVGTDSGGTTAAIVAGSLDDASRVSYDLIRKAVKKLTRNRAQKNTSIVTGSTKIDTRTVNRAFYAIVGPEVKYDLENLTRGADYEKEFVYVPAYKYADATNLAEGEVGAMSDVRFIESESAVNYPGAGLLTPSTTAIGDGEYTGTLASTLLAGGAGAALDAWTTSEGHTTYTGYTDGEYRFDVFPILFPTKGSFATVGLKGHGKIKFNSQSPSKIELDNPFGTQGFFSYNMWYAGIILREERLLKILVCASA